MFHSFSHMKQTWWPYANFGSAPEFSETKTVFLIPIYIIVMCNVLMCGRKMLTIYTSESELLQQVCLRSCFYNEIKIRIEFFCCFRFLFWLYIVIHRYIFWMFNFVCSMISYFLVWKKYAQFIVIIWLHNVMFPTWIADGMANLTMRAKQISIKLGVSSNMLYTVNIHIGI